MKRVIPLLVLLFALQANAVTVLTVFTLSAKTNIDFSVTGVDQKIASFLVVNPTSDPVEMILSFANGCNVEHFRNSTLTVPLTKVRVVVNGDVAHPVDLWTRAGSDCIVMPWSSVGAADKYQFDVLLSWTATPLLIAGTYAESLTINAYNP
jgi:hypothetical protein